MKENKEVKISYLAAHLTTIVSVTLVLLLLGIVALVWTGASNETKRLKENVELSVIMADSITDGQAKLLSESIGKAEYTKSVRLITGAEAMEQWKKDTGEDLEKLFGVNPLSPEISFTLKSEYSNPASIKQIENGLIKQPGVSDVASPDLDMVSSMNKNIETLSVILLIVAGVMIVISFVLINNTVHLYVYSRRFSIHTMQLVGATNGFIRRPFILNNLLSGIIAGLLASGIIALSVLFAEQAGMEGVTRYIPWEAVAIIAAALIVAGALVCVLASWIATFRYLRMNYNQLFK